MYHMTQKLISLFLSLVLGVSLLASFPAEAFAFAWSSVAAYAGAPFAEVNGNVPEFTAEDYTVYSFERYSELDALGRCGAAFACVGTDLMPTEGREPLSSVTPTGWVNVKYLTVPGRYLYNRCHLIGFQLAGENANRRNLITGTVYMNVEGMQPFENRVTEYVKRTGNHVLYRVTPVFVGDDLVARGVLMEALSMEDGGAGVRFCVFCYNVQPGIAIDYATGKSALAEEAQEWRVYTVSVPVTFVVNRNTKKYHLPSCPSAASMSAKNRMEMTLTAAEMGKMGYSPCSRCHPDLQSESFSYRYGDVDLDGTVTPADARLTLRQAVGLESFTATAVILADVDADGAVTPADARKILRAAVGIEQYGFGGIFT